MILWPSTLLWKAEIADLRPKLWTKIFFLKTLAIKLAPFAKGAEREPDFVN